MNRYRLRAGALALAFALLLGACRPSAQPAGSETAETTAIPDVTLPVGSTPYASNDTEPSVTAPATQTPDGHDELPPAKVIYKEPQSGSAREYGRNNNPNNVIDYSNTSQGYFMARSSGETSGMWVGVYRDTACRDLLAFYPLPSDDEWQVFPLQYGSIEYTVRILGTVNDKPYAEAKVTFSVSLADSFLPFLYPTQWTDFRKELAPRTHALSGELTRGKTTDLQKIQAIYEWMVETIDYDYEKADWIVNVNPNYRPLLDEVIEKEKGICSDYAGLMGAMLRLQGIPTKFVYGTVNGAAHAWNSVYTKEKGWITFKIEFTGGAWKLMDATYGVAKGGNIDKYINNNNYTQITDY